MKVSELLAERQQNWAELQRLCSQMEKGGRRRRNLGAVGITRFATLYRAACADLALADAYQLPPNTVQYLHQLVARAHNQLYRSRSFNMRSWLRVMLYDVPRKLFNDNYLRLAFILFFGLFIASYLLAKYSPEFTRRAVGEETMEGMRAMYEKPITGRPMAWDATAAGGYIWHNTGIGLTCFAGGLILGIGGIIVLISNAVQLGAVFGYMDTTPMADNFNEFVVAHGPFELTAIVLSSAAGMRLGFSFIDTQGFTRLASLKRAAREAMPIIFAAVIMFALAAFIEGFISPSAAPKEFKIGVAIVSCALLMFYFVLLGMPQRSLPQASRDEGTWDAAVSQED